MKLVSVVYIGTVIQLCVLLTSLVNTIKVKDRHHRRYRGVVHWTDRFGRDRSMVDPSDSTNGAKPSPSSPSVIDEKSKPSFTEDKRRENNEIGPERNDSVASKWAHPPIPSKDTSTIPNTIYGSQFCADHLPESRICDPEDILSLAEERGIKAALDAICNGTGCPCGNCSLSKPQCPGYRVSLLIFTTGPFSEDAYSYETYVDMTRRLRTDVWRHGSCDEDVVIVLDIASNQIFTSIGSRAAGLLNPQCASEVLFDAQYLLNEKKYGNMLIQILGDYRKVFLNDFKCVIDRDYVMPTGHIIAIIFGSVCLPIMVCVISVFLGPCFRGSGFGGKRHKTTYSKYRYQAQNSDGTWTAAPTGAEDTASLGESTRFQKGIALERRGAAVML